MSLIDKALSEAVLKEAKKLIDINALAKQTADKFDKDFKDSLKKTKLVDSDFVSSYLMDYVDWGKVAKVTSKRVTSALEKAFK